MGICAFKEVDEDEPTPPAFQLAFLEDMVRIMTITVMLSSVARSVLARLALSKVETLAVLGRPLGENRIVKIMMTKLRSE